MCRTCEVIACDKLPIFGFPGRTRRWCRFHKEPGAVNLNATTCESPGCPTVAYFAPIGEKKKRCSKHKLKGDIDVVSQRCEYPGCLTGPHYAQPGEKRKRCGKHKIDGDVNVHQKPCEYPGCTITPSFAAPGEKKKRCFQHRHIGDINVIAETCEYPECPVAASFSAPGEKRKRCFQHKIVGDVNVKEKLCEHPKCSIQAGYGKPGEGRKRCVAHKITGDVDQFNKRCLSEVCVNSYTKYERPLAIRVDPSTGKKDLCTSCWRILYPDLDKKLSVLKEHFILAELQRQLPELEEYFLTHDCRIPGQACSSKRPDMVWIVNDTLVHVEIDEWGKRHEDSLERLVGIHAASGIMYHSCIRFNPDAYEDYPSCLRKKYTRMGEPVYSRNKREWLRRIPILVENMKEVVGACLMGDGVSVAGKRKLCF